MGSVVRSVVGSVVGSVTGSESGHSSASKGRAGGMQLLICTVAVTDGCLVVAVYLIEDRVTVSYLTGSTTGMKDRNSAKAKIKFTITQQLSAGMESKKNASMIISSYNSIKNRKICITPLLCKRFFHTR